MSIFRVPVEKIGVSTLVVEVEAHNSDEAVDIALSLALVGDFPPEQEIEYEAGQPELVSNVRIK